LSIQAIDKSSPQGENDRTVSATLQAPRDLTFTPCNRL
jgi:hypothetical protein